MKKLNTAWVCLMALTAHAQAVTDAPVPDPGEAVIITKSALAAYRDGYLTAEDNKAFAQAPSGAWWWVGGRTTTTHAIQNALDRCRLANERDEKLGACRLINVNAHWVNPQ